MSLIRKPGIEEFRDSAGVRAVRGAKGVAVAGGGSALRTVRNLWLGMILLVFLGTGVGYAGSAASAGIGRFAIYIGMMTGAVWLLFRLFKPATRVDGKGRDLPLSEPDHLSGISVPLPEHLRPVRDADGDGPFAIDYWPRALADKVAWNVIWGLLLAWLAGGVLLFVSLAMLGRAALLARPLRGSRACVRARADGLQVCSLWAPATLAWAQVGDVLLDRVDLRNGWLWLTTGSRRVVRVRGPRGTVAGDLLIPYPLLGLDDEGGRWLAARLRAEVAARRGEVAPLAAANAAVPAMPPVATRAAPALRALSREFARPPGERATGAPPEPFDADRIMHRYLADRAAMVEAADLPPVRRPSFGRKGLS